MKKQALFMVVFLAAVGLLAGLSASAAFANAGGLGNVACGLSGCHGTLHAGPTVTLQTNDGTNATYSVTATAAFQWAVFKDTPATLIGDVKSTATGTFTVPVGSSYTVYAVYGDPKAVPDSGGATQVSPQGASSFTITPTAGAHGAISPATVQTVLSGAAATFTITPDAGYHVADVLVNGTSVGAVTSYTFTSVTANSTIAATFAQDTASTFTITTSAGANGAITPTGPQTVNSGADITFTVKPNAGYYLDTLTVDGTAVQPAASYTFKNVTKDHTIAATFAATPASCAISASVVGAAGGTIWPPNPVWTMAPGSSITYYFLSNPGFHVEKVLVDGWPVALDEDDAYTFWAIDRNHTVSVEFAANRWNVAASVTGNGTISPSGTQQVLEGSALTYTFTPKAGNKLSDVLVDGVSVGIPDGYTFEDITANHTIQAKFVADSANFTVTPSVVGGLGGTISPAFAYTVASGGSITFDFLPNDGYMVGTVTVDGTPVLPGALNDGESYTFANVTANHTIAVSFVPMPATYIVTPSAGEHGAISPAEPQTVAAGDDVAFTITPDAGYHVADVLVDGQSVGAVTTYTFADVAEDHEISATFAWSKLPTTATLKAGVRTARVGASVKLTATLRGGTFATGTSVRIEVKKPGARAYRLFKNCRVSPAGVATCKYKVTAKGSWYFRVRFLGNETCLAAPVKPGVRVVVR